MLQILLLILKILGIVLLAILGLALLLILIVLFVPIRYKAEAAYVDKNPSAQAKISWLLGLVRFQFTFVNGKIDGSLKLLVFTLFHIPKGSGKKDSKEAVSDPDDIADDEPMDFTSIDAAQEEAPLNKAAAKPDGHADTLPPKHKDVPEADTSKITQTAKPAEPQKSSGADVPDKLSVKTSADVPDKLSVKTSDTESQADPTKEAGNTDEASNAPEAKVDLLELILDKLDELDDKLDEIIENVSSKIDTLEGKADELIRKKDIILAFLDDPDNRKLFHLVWERLGKLIRHILPTYWHAALVYGDEDCSKLGQIVAYASMAYPLYYDNFDFTPVFGEKALEGGIKLKGRIRIAAILWTGIRIILNKNARLLIKKIKNKTFFDEPAPKKTKKQKSSENSAERS